MPYRNHLTLADKGRHTSHPGSRPSGQPSRGGAAASSAASSEKNKVGSEQEAVGGAAAPTAAQTIEPRLGQEPVEADIAMPKAGGAEEPSLASFSKEGDREPCRARKAA